MSDPAFVHLEVHTEFSLINSLVRVDRLCDRLSDLSMKMIAVTDLCNLFALVKVYQAATRKKIKPLVGAEIWIESPDPKNPYRFLALCQNSAGYKHLNQLISSGYLEHDRADIPILKQPALNAYHEGLIFIVLPEGYWSDLVLLPSKREEQGRILEEWKALLGNRLYLAIRRIGRAMDEPFIQAAKKLSIHHQLPLVATNGVLFLYPSDFEAHEARVCIHEGQTLEHRKQTPYTREQYLKTEQEMCQLFADIPESLVNSVEIAKRCTVTLQLGKTVLPQFDIAEGFSSEGEYLSYISHKGLSNRLGGVVPTVYQERLDSELQVIINMGFSGYFLIVSDFIQWAKDQKIPVGPGRGSGAGSLVAYVLGITDLDPITYDLLFERFLNPERVSMPDFDVDFCMEKRDKVIDYVAQKYGRERVSQIVTFGTMAAKAVIRDVGRVLGHPYGFVDKIAKLIPFEIGMTLEKAMIQEPMLKERYEQEEELKNLMDLALKLEGLTRNVGKHAGGVVIAPYALTDFAPLYSDRESESLVTQFDKDDVESIGLIKFDFLGLKTLTVIDWAVKNVNRLNEVIALAPIDISAIPLDDVKTFQLLQRCATTAVFQLESRGMKELIGRLHPDSFEEIIALVALFRPGPLQSGMVDDFINRKHGKAVVEYPHPDCEIILKPTYGVILYQEQVMQIAQVLAGYTLGSADLLRRAMGKKKPEEMAQQREIFVQGAVSRGVDSHRASHIFDLIEKFAGYGFNKSHSAAYALVSYQTAWLKAHYPTAFMAAVLSSDMNHTEKVVKMVEESRALGIVVLPPDVNRSDYYFTVLNHEQLTYGMGAIKGVGESALENILHLRQAGGPFKDFSDFCQRIDTRKVNKRVLEALIRSGAFDTLELNRAQLMNDMAETLHYAEQQGKNKSVGQGDLFQEAMSESPIQKSVLPWSDEQRLRGEKETLGLYLTGHPYQSVAKELSSLVTAPIGQLKHKDNAKIMIAGLLTAVKTLFTKKGDKMAILQLEDGLSSIEITLFSDLYLKNQDKLSNEAVLIIEGATSFDKMNHNLRIRAYQVWTLEETRELLAKKVIIRSFTKTPDPMNILKSILSAYERGNCDVFIPYQNEKATVMMKLGNTWSIKPTFTVVQELKKAFGEENIELMY